MKFNFANFLDFARELNESELSEGEARNRTVISRAYYALYKKSKEFAEEDGKNFVGENKHKQVKDHYAKSHNSKYRKVGSKLRTLKKWRKDADYNTNPSCNISEVPDKAVEECQKGLDGLEEI